MEIILFRHAKKGFMPFEDPSLSPQGLLQSRSLPDTVQNLKLPEPTALWVSEKIRTHQTFQYLGECYKIPLTVKAELNLRMDRESATMFTQRVQAFIEQLSLSTGKTKEKSCIYLCTHYDWIETAMTLIPCDTNLNSFEFAHWAPAQFIHFMVEAHKDEKIWKYLRKGSQS